MSARTKVLTALGALILLAGAFSAGRFTAPLKTETKEVERVVYKDKLVEVVKTVEVKAKEKTRIVYRDRVVTPDGTVTEREVEKTDTKSGTETRNDGERFETHDGEGTRELVSTVTLRPNWRVGLLAGASLTQPLVTIAGPLVLGVSVEYRIVGGLSAGLWINTVGAAGLSLSLEF